jgi:anti-sigma B factor antagonist
MFDIQSDASGRVRLSGRFDASQVETARAVLDSLTASTVVDFGQLDYISSAGLGLLLGTQKRLAEAGKSLKLLNMNKHIREIFKIAGFDRVFEIE